MTTSPSCFLVLFAMPLTLLGCGENQNLPVAHADQHSATNQEAVMSGADARANGIAAVENSELLRWPLNDGFSDPNLVVYDKAQFDRYLSFHAPKSYFRCGTSAHKMMINGSLKWFTTGIDECYGGGLFHVDHLRKFLRDRLRGTKSFYSDDETLQRRQIWLPPYESDIRLCITVLGRAKADEALPELIALLADSHAGIQMAAILAIANLGPKAAGAADDVAKLLESNLGSEAANALAKIGRSAVPTLAARVNAGGIEARIHSIEALGRIGPDASSAVDELIEALHSFPDSPERAGSISTYAAEALGHIQDRRALPQLRAMADAQSIVDVSATIALKNAIREIENQASSAGSNR